MKIPGKVCKNGIIHYHSVCQIIFVFDNFNVRFLQDRLFSVFVVMKGCIMFDITVNLVASVAQQMIGVDTNNLPDNSREDRNKVQI